MIHLGLVVSMTDLEQWLTDMSTTSNDANAVPHTLTDSLFCTAGKPDPCFVVVG